MEPLNRLLRPRSIAVIGGGAWCANVIRECHGIGFAGEIWPVHPNRTEIAGLPTFAAPGALPAAPDAAFIGVNREATVEVVATLSAMGAGGAVCFASGFREAVAELADGSGLQDRLVAAAGAMRLLGPNCYGFINALDGAALWPDLHGMLPCDRGVAIIGQSSNVAINLTMQRRGLPLAYMVTVGNQAQTGFAEIGMALLDDARVTALGLHIEGIGDLRALEALAARAAELGKPVVALKTGASDQARVATISHTASMAGTDAGARALLRRLGIAQVKSPAVLLETLKLLHLMPRLGSNRIASMSCSGGEASLMADLALGTGLDYPPLDEIQTNVLRSVLGPRVALANPLDYHTYIWGDRTAMARCFSAMMLGDVAMGCVVLDFPRTDRFKAPDWQIALDAVADARVTSGKPIALVASMPEGMPEDVATEAIGRGIVPFCGMAEALAALGAVAGLQSGPAAEPLLLPGSPECTRMLDEADAKHLLARHGFDVPRGVEADGIDAALTVAGEIGFPVVLKGAGIAHKTEAGAVAVNLRDADALRRAAESMPTDRFLVEEMIGGAVGEMIVGVQLDPAHGFVLTLGAGGIVAELMTDTVSLLLPVTAAEIHAALSDLHIFSLLSGFRGAPAADICAVVDAILAVQDFVQENRARLVEAEVNPLLCTPSRAVAADALIVMGE